MRRILFVSHCPSEHTITLRESVLRAIGELDLENVEVISRAPLDTGADDVLACEGIIIGTTENFGSMAGLTKDFFERIYYACLERSQGLPICLYIRAGEDGRGTRTSIAKITTGLRWQLIAEPLILRGAYASEFEGQVAELGMTMAAGLDAEVF